MNHTHTTIPTHNHGLVTDMEICTYPFDAVEENCEKILIYKAAGFNKDMLYINENWHNKEKKMYIDIQGSRFFGRDKEERIDIHIFLDTDIYGGYSIQVEDGLIIVTLYEILNTPPEIRRVDI